MSAHGLAQRLRHLGVTKEARYGAFHDLVIQIPSPLLAGLLGYNPVVIATRAEALATPWHHYAALATDGTNEPSVTRAPTSTTSSEADAAACAEPPSAENHDAVG